MSPAQLWGRPRHRSPHSSCLSQLWKKSLLSTQPPHTNLLGGWVHCVTGCTTAPYLANPGGRPNQSRENRRNPLDRLGPRRGPEIHVQSTKLPESDQDHEQSAQFQQLAAQHAAPSQVSKSMSPAIAFDAGWQAAAFMAPARPTIATLGSLQIMGHTFERPYPTTWQEVPKLPWIPLTTAMGKSRLLACFL